MSAQHETPTHSAPTNPTADRLSLSHAEMYVEDLASTVSVFVDNYGFTAFADAEQTGPGGAARSVALRQNDIVLVVTQPLDAVHPAAAFVARHGDGVADIALSAPDVREAFREAVARSAVALAEPAERDGQVIAVLAGGFDDIRHSLVQRPAGSGALPLPGFTLRPGTEAHGSADAAPGELVRLDHVAVTVRAGELAPATAYYERIFGYHSVYEELMVQGSEAMDSKAVRSPAGDVTFTVLAPSADHDAGHIGDFVAAHGSGGIHHLAFTTEDIVRSVARLGARGVEFLDTPGTYYERLAQRLTPLAHSHAELRAGRILADEDHDGQLFQIFTRTTHPRRTFFFEVIERMGADSFGGGNVRALYEAVQAEKSANLAGAAR